MRCLFCGSKYSVQAHHIRLGTDGGIGLKPSDYYTIPLCVTHHKEVHDKGEFSTYNKYKRFFMNKEPKDFARDFLYLKKL